MKGLLNATNNVIAVRCSSPGGPKSNDSSRPGGLYDSGAPDGRVGPYDAVRRSFHL